MNFRTENIISNPKLAPKLIQILEMLKSDYVRLPVSLAQFLYRNDLYDFKRLELTKKSKILIANFYSKNKKERI